MSELNRNHCPITIGIGVRTESDLPLILISLMVAWLAIAYRYKKRIHTLEDFFLANRDITGAEFTYTYLGANVLFTSIFYVLSSESFGKGIVIIWIPIAWVLGSILFVIIYPRISEFCGKGFTLHQYIYEAFGYSLRLRQLASIWTIIGFVGIVGLELIGGSWLLGQLGLPHLVPLSFAILIAVVMILYTTLGGFWGTIATDKYQMALLLVVIAIFLIYLDVPSGFATNAISIPGFSLSDLFSDPLFIVASFILFLPFQFCVMDMWQRCIAAGGVVSKVRKSVLIGGLGTGLLFLVPILVGVSVRAELGLATEIEEPLFYFLSLMDNPIIIGIVFAGFIAAILSTADTLLINSAYTFLYDIWCPLKGQDVRSKDKDFQHKLVNSAKFWVSIFGASSIFVFLLIEIGFSLYNLIFAIFSSQIAFFVLIMIAIFKPETAKRNSTPAFIALIFGYLAPLVMVSLGALSGDKMITDSAPIVAFLITAIVFSIAVWIKSWSHK